MRALVVGAAPEPHAEAFYATLLADADAVVAADAGGEWCIALGRVPDVVVGDFDSAKPGAAERLASAGAAVRAVSAHKDDSDLDLAVAVARQLGATSLSITAAFSRRLDHTLASLGTLASAADLGAVGREPHLTAWTLDAATRAQLTLALPVGTLVSVFALGEATGVTLEGFEYPLSDARLGPLSSLGLSNVAADEDQRVRVGSGRLVVVSPR